MLIRSSKHILKFANEGKQKQLSELFYTYKSVLQEYINLMWSGQLPTQKHLTCKYLPNAHGVEHSRWKQQIYKNASEIIRANRKRKKTSRPNVQNVGINLDYRFFDLEPQKDSSEFDEFVRLKLPWFLEKKRWSKTINLPIKNHKHSNLFKDWNRKNTIKLTYRNGNFYMWFVYEKEEPKIKPIGKSIGLDCGYKTLLASSEHELLGQDVEDIYEKIAHKKRGSKNYIQALQERDNKINQVCNEIDVEKINHIVVEDLKNVKKKSRGKIHKKFMNKLQYWSYKKTLDKLERVCNENGICYEKVSPAYTSQKCSKCGSIDKTSRSGEKYICTACGMKMNADINASINILHRGAYSPSNFKSENI